MNLRIPGTKPYMHNQDNPLQSKSYLFSCQIVTLYKSLTSEKKEFILSKQLIRSGTSIGANIEEALGGQSGKDFQHKMAIAYKEALESRYWIRLLTDTNYIAKEDSQPLLDLLVELLKMLGSIQKTMKSK